MKYKSIKLIVLNIVILLIFQLSFADNLILPKKKPLISNKVLKESKIKNILVPKKKPGKLKKIVEKTNEEEKKKVSKINGIIIPKNKPLIVRKQSTRITKKSNLYSDRDFEYAKQAVQFMEKSNWRDAIKVSKKARAKSIYNFIQWKHLLTTGNQASFYDYKAFIEYNSNYPRINRIKYLAEHKISLKSQSSQNIINWCNRNEPLSGFGKMILGESFISIGEKSKGINLIKE